MAAHLPRGLALQRLCVVAAAVAALRRDGRALVGRRAPGARAGPRRAGVAGVAVSGPVCLCVCVGHGGVSPRGAGGRPRRRGDDAVAPRGAHPATGAAPRTWEMLARALRGRGRVCPAPRRWDCPPERSPCFGCASRAPRSRCRCAWRPTIRAARCPCRRRWCSTPPTTCATSTPSAPGSRRSRRWAFPSTPRPGPSWRTTTSRWPSGRTACRRCVRARARPWRRSSHGAGARRRAASGACDGEGSARGGAARRRPVLHGGRPARGR